MSTEAEDNRRLRISLADAHRRLKKCAQDQALADVKLEVLCRQRDEARAEVEQLKAELEIERTAEKMQRDKAIANYAEVRRLRAEVEHLTKIRAAGTKRVNEDADKIEQLRQAQTAIKADMEQRCLDLEAKIERLRAALHQYADQRNWFQTTHQTVFGIPAEVWAWDDQREPWSMARKALDTPPV